MEYLVKSSILYGVDQKNERQILARIVPPFHCAVKNILTPSGKLLLSAQIQKQRTVPNLSPRREYNLFDPEGRLVLSGTPQHASEEEMADWMAFRLPRIDRAELRMGKISYLLTMQNSQNYSLTDQTGKTIWQMVHQEIFGGWKIHSSVDFTPEIQLGLFIFCRNLEYENELVMV